MIWNRPHFFVSPVVLKHLFLGDTDATADLCCGNDYVG